jgi:hypothetical protein
MLRRERRGTRRGSLIDVKDREEARHNGDSRRAVVEVRGSA